MPDNPQPVVARATPTFSDKAIIGQEFLQAEGGPSSEVKLTPQLTPTQEAGMRLALWVGILIGIVIIFVCADWLLTIPPPPTAWISAGTDRQLQRSARCRHGRLFQTV